MSQDVLHDTTRQESWIVTLIKDNAITLALLVCSTFITLLNVFAFVKLAPIVQSISGLDTRVQAVEQYQTDGKAIRERFFKMEAVSQEIKDRLNRMEDKLDVLIQR